MKLDPVGYFLIRINRDTKEVEVAFCTYKEKKPSKIWKNTDIDKLYDDVVAGDEYISLDSHKEYLRVEFAHALQCIVTGEEYVQE